LRDLPLDVILSGGSQPEVPVKPMPIVVDTQVFRG